MANIYTYIGDHAVENLLQYCETRKLSRFLLVADRNTYAVLGRSVEIALQGCQWEVNSMVFDGPLVVPDEQSIFQVLMQADQVERTYLAVGSGTLTDITRIVSHRTRCPFISLPTAPSVDGFTSPSASLVIGRVKQTVTAQPPIAVIADLGTLVAAPQPMIASGYGDILGKAIALADWKLGHLFWGEPYDVDIARRVRETLDACVEATAEIGQASSSGVRKLMFSLIDSGFCMLDFNNSRPAAGAEHYMSHFLEMKLLREGRPAVLHGAKVGLSSIYIADLYARLRQVGRAEALQRLQAAYMPDRSTEVQRIRSVYGPIADKMISEQMPFIDLSPEDFAQLKHRIADHWEDIQALATEVPETQWFFDHLSWAGGAATPGALGLSDEEVEQALLDAHLLRNRFTICKLGRLLNLKDGL
jgi:glycerol-1-phosphate dehydrogenase [NAD(P)+]